MEDIGQRQPSSLKNAWKFSLDLRLSKRKLDRVFQTLIVHFKDKRSFQLNKIYNVINCLIANLLYAKEINSKGYLRYSRRHDEYKRTIYNKLSISSTYLKEVIDTLVKLNFLENVKGVNSIFLSRIRATNLLENIFIEENILICDVYYDKELLILKNKNKKKINYLDEEYTTQIKRNLINYNELLLNNKITNHLVNKHQRLNKTYYRVFSNSSFKSHGRYYGHWIVDMNDTVRKETKMNGQQVKIVDFEASQTHMAYSLKGINYFDYTDIHPYNFLSENFYIPSGKRRDFIKKVTSLFLNCSKDKFKRALYFLNNTQFKIKNLNVSMLHNEFNEFHKPISEYFFKSLGNKLMFIESQIAERTIIEFCKLNIPILIIHDCFIVPEDRINLLKNSLKNSFNECGFKSIPRLKVS